jgi:tetratricopeptide (TPR) repeat protein
MNGQSSESSPPRAGPSPTTTFVGRQSELAALESGLDRAVAGRASFFLVTGEAGIGKSRLVEEIGTVAQSKGVRVVTGRCWEAVDAPAYWPWIQVLRQLCSEMADSELRGAAAGVDEIAHLVPQVAERLGMVPSMGAAPPNYRFGFFDSVVSFVRSAAEARPTMVVLEDLHAADESSLLMLQFLVRQDSNAHLTVVGTYDDVAGRGKPDHARLLSETAREGRRLPLRGLDHDSVKQLYESSAGPRPLSAAIIRAVHEASEGNPLFVDEAIRMLSTRGDIHRPDYSVGFRVPEGAGGIIRRRLAALGDEVEELLSVASVIGREFDLTLLQSVVDIELDALLEILGQAVDAGVIEETSALGRYAFTHILIRETLYEDLTAARRMRLHCTVAETLEESYAALEARLPELAHHWFKSAQAGDAAKTMRYAIRAAEHAMSQHAYEEAVRLYQRALKVSESAGADVLQIEKIRAGLADARATAKPSDQSPTAITTGLFIREGDYWTIGYAGREMRLRDVKGLRYIAQLLKVPGQEVHVLDLAAMVEGAVRPSRRRGEAQDDLVAEGLGDAGGVLDAAAKSAYKARLEVLREELEEAQEFNDPERASRAQVEIDALVDQLAAGVGLGGRDRKAASQAERARVNITKSVKDALKKIHENHDLLGEHLRTTIRTGAYCAYLPDPRLLISWRT